MDWKNLLTGPHLLEAAGAAWAVVWLKYKEEIISFFVDSGKRLLAWLFRSEGARRLPDAELRQILASGLSGIESLLLVLAKEYAADRVTVTTYRKNESSYLATLLVEVREAEMQSVRAAWQDSPVASELWDEIERIHNLPGRWTYVPDARLVDIAALRVALTESGVRSAYYQTLADSKGKARATLAISWHHDHPLSHEQTTAIHSSGIACATVLLLMDKMQPPTT